jgi:hypothetical protein
MGFIEAWGFDPDQVSGDRRAIRDERQPGDFLYSNDDEEAAEIPASALAQVDELCRMFGL